MTPFAYFLYMLWIIKLFSEVYKNLLEIWGWWYIGERPTCTYTVLDDALECLHFLT